MENDLTLFFSLLGLLFILMGLCYDFEIFSQKNKIGVKENPETPFPPPANEQYLIFPEMARKLNYHLFGKLKKTSYFLENGR